MCSGRSRLPLRCASNSHLCSSRLHVAPILTRKIQKVCSRTSFGASVGKEDWRWRPTVLLVGRLCSTTSRNLESRDLKLFLRKAVLLLSAAVGCSVGSVDPV
ncbi:uncharacterized protein LOC144988889 isoform X2 [Oryzias latipes]